MKNYISLTVLVLITAIYFYMSLFDELKLPFIALSDRTRLISYMNFAGIVFFIPLVIGFFPLFIFRLKNKKPYKNAELIICIISVLIAILSLLPRYHLGTRIEAAGYVKCVKESRTSATSSWRVYAKSIDLCKESSGIAGG
ncbi:hypothetical protein MED121_17454 [Marinomonas sp. MED121]|uniref:DUF1240 domain-containing protein n=1 Tax=Marinomonas sp. MED121 TaxID=314277 RepID=UPI0000691219|nr:DUF1240 domain-containing protein [Marinomonas sp. MED121]EAQ67736.1 hypothetical protein MED121_17454 [Marinomonas sp. MED121]